MTTPHPTPLYATTPRARVFTPFVIIFDSDNEITSLPIRPTPPSPYHIPALYGYPLDFGDNSSDEDLSNTIESLHTQQKNTLAEYMILSGADNRPPMLDKVLTKKYAELSAAEKIQVDCDMKATNMILQGDDLISCLHKAMAFLTAVASSRGNTTSGQAKVVKCYNCQGEGHMARQCTQPKRPRNAAWYKEKAMLAEAQKAGQILDEEQLAFLADLGILAGQVQTIIPHNASSQTEDLDTYDSDCDDLSNAQAVLMANISNYSSDVISEKIKELNNIVFKGGQSAQTVHVLTKPQSFYENVHKQALGYQNPFYLKKAQWMKPTLYDGIVISEKHVLMPMIDNEETLMLEEANRSKISKKAKDPEVIAKKISHKPIDYEKLNRLTDNFGKCCTPQQELSAEQAF
nr:hypothetical protein [Tanacetum cinerariifolium]